MLNFGSLPRSQQVILGVGAVGIGALLLLLVAMFGSQVGTSLTGTLDEPLEGDTLPGDSAPLAEAPGTGDGTTQADTGTAVPPPPTIDTPPGVSHITYIAVESDRYVLRYANNDGGSWSVETAASDSSSDGGQRKSMAVGTDGSIHVVYLSGRPYPTTIRYAVRRGGSWTVTNIPAGTSAPEAVSLELDRSGNAHVAFVKSGSSPPDQGVWYASNRTGAWVVEKVRDGSHPYYRTGGPIALALDASGTPHVTFVSLETPPPGERGLLHAKKTGDTWQITVVDPATNLASQDIGVDSQGSVHVAYTLYGEPTLKYAINSSGSWNRETVSTIDEPTIVALALPQGGTIPQIAFVQREPAYGYRGRVMHATPDLAGVRPGWRIQPVTNLGQNFLVVSLDVDEQGKAYMSLIGDVTTSYRWQVWHATNALGSWTTEVVSRASEDVRLGDTSIRVR